MPKLLDLYCGAGGAAMGYHRAGFEVVGVDIAPQPNYPFDFVQADALTFVGGHWQAFDAIHASPPCQRYSQLNRRPDLLENSLKFDDLLGETRAVLRFIGLPYIIENVVGAPMKNPLTLCGSMFEACKVYRHRLFESNVMLLAPVHTPHRDKTPSSGRGVSPKGYVSVTGNGGIARRNLPDGWQGTASVAVEVKVGRGWQISRVLGQAVERTFENSPLGKDNRTFWCANTACNIAEDMYDELGEKMPARFIRDNYLFTDTLS